MTGRSLHALVSIQLKATFIALCCAGLAYGDDGRDRDRDGPIPLTVPKAKCGPNDHPETALQGQVPAALRASGFHGFNCNLELVGQFRGNGANWQTTQFKQRVRGNERDDDDDGDDRGNSDGKTRVCGYHGTASPALSAPGRTQFGVPVIDLSDPHHPNATAFLTTPSMLDPWESLKVNERRQLLGADNGQNGGGGPEIDIYDVSQDCSHPQLIVSKAVGTGADGGIVAPVVGHEGSWAPDGLTYYGGDLRNRQYYAVDTSDPSRPKLLATWVPGFANVHGLSIRDDGNRGYFVSLDGGVDLTNPAVPATNGLMIYDLSEIQARKPNPQAKLVSKLFWKDGSGAQHTIPVRIDGKPFIIHVDEAGSGGFSSAAQIARACAANLPPFPMARLIDISDEKNPQIVSRVMLETHDPANCAKVQPDLVGLSIFTYGSHYCSVDNRHHATTLACGYFNSGIRVFDIRDPKRPKEIAYFNPAGTTTISAGSNHPLANNWRSGGPDWCSAQVHLDAKNARLWTTCQDNGVLVLKFREGVWPFPESSTPPGLQN
ncbi:MAG TPA: hypothetical protein VLI89_02985 [Burkholderiales bacterium]|nr:hypothetical protein [Burkholderiales bacterium]